MILRKGEREKGKKGARSPLSFHFPLLLFSLSLLLLFFGACSELQKPKTEPFYAETAPPQKKEFRWTNGKMPKSFDPALAAAPPETDIVRAVYEGLTDTDPKTLEPIPSVAVKWTPSEDFKTWTFELRRDARWSNGERVTAKDFVRSWQRLAEIGDRAAHRKLLKNIIGMRIAAEPANVIDVPGAELSVVPRLLDEPTLPLPGQQIEPKAAPPPIKSPEVKTNAATETKTEEKEEAEFGAVAVDNYTLKVTLVNADKNFPALVAHPMFRPIYGDGKDFEAAGLNAAVVTNGAFRIASVGQDGITLDRAEYYWNKDMIELERVRFVPTENAEKALEEYRAGNVDAVTNAEFEPLALKLLEPFDDFRRTTHGALNFYEFNRSKKPFDDRRVREALAIAIERERLTEGEMEDATEPALRFLPFNKDEKKMTQDSIRAQFLLAEAGFPDGENFPPIKLVVNRNHLQQRIARGVAKMWKQNLNLNTEIHVKESGEIDEIRKTGDFDLVRRGEVFPVRDETANMLAIFAPETETPETVIENTSENKTDNGDTENERAKTDEVKTEAIPPQIAENQPSETTLPQPMIDSVLILTEDEAITELPAIPLYFPTSYSLVKPYVLGFEINSLDAPSLKDVRIDNNWQPKKGKGES